MSIELSSEECLNTFKDGKSPRPYQSAAINDLVDGLSEGKDIALSLPTGTGKTYVYLPVASAAVNRGYRVCILAGTNLLIDQLLEKYVINFNTEIQPHSIKGIENYPCILTGDMADYSICNREQRLECEKDEVPCDVLRVIHEMEEYGYIISNFHKFLSTPNLGFDLVIIDDSHGFENALEDKFQTRISYYFLDRVYLRYDGSNNVIADFVGEFLDIFDSAFGAIPGGIYHRRLPSDTVREIANLEGLEDLENILPSIDISDRRVLYDLSYFVHCCINSTINTFYIQKDYYKEDDPLEAALVARKSDRFQRNVTNSKFKDSQTIFASATMGNITTHVKQCTNKEYDNSNLLIAPTTTSDIIRNWFNFLNILKVTDVGESIKEKSSLVSLLLQNIPGKSLLLFKSYRDQRMAENILLSNVDRSITFIDESLNNEEVQNLVQKADIIMASASSRLWEGIDIRGMRFEIIFSLPFIRPPVYLDPSRSFPFVRRKMLLRLQQGIGRLIRNYNDHGVCVILDPRLDRYQNSSNFSEAYRAKIRNVESENLLSEVENSLIGV